MKRTADTLGPLLHTEADKPCATFITLFLNAVPHVKKILDDPTRADTAVERAMHYLWPTASTMPPMNTLRYLMGQAEPLTCDRDFFFNR